MNIDKLFKTEKEKKEAEEMLRALINNEAWRFLKEKILSVEIENLSNLILEEEINDINKINELKQQRWNLVHLQKLPERLLEALSETEEKKELDEDPYL